MKITWDAKAKAVYIQLVEEERRHWKTVPLLSGGQTGEINVDYDTSGEVTGIEILNVQAEPTIERL